MRKREPGRIKSTYAQPMIRGEARQLSAVDGGTGLTAGTAVYVALPQGTNYVQIKPRNFITAVVAQLGFCAYLWVMKTADDGDTFTDYSSEAQDQAAGTDVTLSSLDTAANGDYLYVGAGKKFNAIKADIDSANGTASVMTAEVYTKAGWVAQAITDGTASGGATLAVDGNISWTETANWEKTRVNGRMGYWIRFKVSVQLDSSVTLNALTAEPRWEVSGGGEFELVSGDNELFAIDAGPSGYRFIKADVNAGTGSLIVNAYSGEEDYD